MPSYGFEEAHSMLMSASPGQIGSSAAAWRNLSALASGMAAQMRQQGAAAGSTGGDPAVAAQQQAEQRAQWFDQVSTSSSTFADKLDHVSQVGHTSQATASTAYAEYRQAAARDSVAGAGGAQDMAVIHTVQSGSARMNSAISDWSAAYGSIKAPDLPPVPGATGSGGSGGPGGSTSPGSGSGAGAGGEQPIIAGGGGGAGGTVGAGGPGGAGGSVGGTGTGGAQARAVRGARSGPVGSW